MKKIWTFLKTVFTAGAKPFIWVFKLPGRLLGRVRFQYTPPEWTQKKSSTEGQTSETPPKPGYFKKIYQTGRDFLSFILKNIAHFYRWEEGKNLRMFTRYGGTILGLGLIFLGTFALLREPENLVRITVGNPSPQALSEGAGIPPLFVNFSNSAARIDLVGKPVPQGILANPPLLGEWTWSSDSQLMFFPQKNWSPGETYTLDFDRALFREDLLLASTQARFSTPDFTVSLDSAELYTNPKNPKERKVVATVSFNYPVDTASFQNSLELRIQKGDSLGGKKEFTPEVTYDKFFGKAYISSERLELPLVPTEVRITLKGGIKPQISEKSRSQEIHKDISIPGVYDHVAYTSSRLHMVRNDNYEFEHILTLELSNPAFTTEIQNNVKAYLLPKDRIGIPGYQDYKDHPWNLREIDRNVLGKSQVIALKPIPSETDASRAVSFKYTAPSGRFLYVEAAGELKVFGDYKIKDPLKSVNPIPQIPKTLTIMSQGSLLSLSGEKTLSLVSNDLEGINFEINRLLPDQVNHLVTQTSGDFQNLTFRYNYNFNEQDMSAYYQEKRTLGKSFPGAVQYSSFDFSKYLDDSLDPALRYGLFLFKATEVKGENSEYEDDSELVKDTRFILVTDLGILIKKSPSNIRDVFVHDIRSGRPREGALVKVLGRNGLSVFTGYTDFQGHLVVPSLEGFIKERTPVVVTVESQGDLSFLPISAQDRFLNYSRFDIGGVQGATLPETLNAFLFSDRGLYRPGDLMNAAYILKSGDWNRSLAGLPLEATIIDPRGVEIYKKNLTLDPSGFGEINFRTFDTSPTGSYQINLSLIKPEDRRQLLGSTTVRVEEFTPDRLTVTSHVEQASQALWIPFNSQKINVKVMNLYGLPAEGNTVKGNFRLSPKRVTPPGYRDYTFSDAYETDKFYEEELTDAITDASGQAVFDVDLGQFEPATFLMTFQGEAKEKSGGRGVVTETSVVVSPLEFILGYKSDGSLSYIRQNSPRVMNYIAINSQGLPTNASKLKMQIDEIRYISVLNKQDDGTYRYQSVEKKIRLSETPFEVSAEGTSFSLDTQAPGDFEVRLLQGDRVISRSAYTVVGKGNLSRTLDREAELQIVLNKDSYNPGEQVQLQIKAPYTGSGIITIERDKVYATQWFTTDTTTSLQTITVPEGIEGTAYVNVSFIRGLDSREIFTSPLSYGVVPFKVNLNRRNLPIVLNSPDLARPGKPYTMTYSTDRPSKIVVFAVDEGILQLARYKTPAPLSFFFQKQALEVQTSQILDLILPEFSLVREASAMGGGGGDELAKNLNPFKRKSHEPVAFWSGILNADTTQRSVTYQVPSWFNGTMRIMAVAVAPDAIGTFQKQALIRSDFILTPTLPLFVAPGDQFDMGVTVANNSGEMDEEKEITLSLSSGSGSGAQASFTVLGKNSQTIKLKRQKEGTLWFKLQAGALPGEVSVKMTAQSGNLSSDMTESMSLRPGVAYRESLASGIQGKGSLTIPVDRNLLPQFRKLSLNLSYLPESLSVGLLGYLQDYPFGCTEQILSQGFPLLSLSKEVKMGITRERARKSFDAVLAVLKARQNSDGSIGLWSANENVSPFAVAYAVHYLMEAAAQGFSGGEGVKTKALEYLAGYIQNTGNDRFESTAAAYGVYVLTLNQKVTTNLLADLRNKFDRDNREWKKQITGLYMAGSYALLKKQGEFEYLIREFGQTQRTDFDYWYDSSLMGEALRLFMLARHGTMDSLFGQGERIQRMSSELAQNNFTTLSAVFSILGFQSYSDRIQANTPENLKVSEVLKDGKLRPLIIPKDKLIQLTYSPEAQGLKIENAANLDLIYQMVNSGFDVKQPVKALAQGVEVFREFKNSQGKTVTEFQRGEEYTAVLRIRSLKGTLTNLALIDLLPGGCEVVLDTQDNQSFDKLLEGNMETDFAQAREDRVLIMTHATERMTEAQYKIRALNTGTFLLPSVSIEAMYNRNIRGMTPGGTLQVKE